MGVFAKHQDQVGYGHTYDLWKNGKWSEIFIERDRNVGYGIWEDFVSFDSAVDAAAATVRYGSGGQRIYIDASSTVAPITGLIGGGVRLFNTADDEECWMQWGGITGAPFCISDSAPHELILEFVFKINAITDSKSGWFMGLMQEGCAAADTIADAGTLADKDYLGFHRLEGDGDKLDIVYKLAGQTAVVHKADWMTLTADTWYKVGLRFNEIAKTITPYYGVGTGATAMIEDTANKITATDIASATDIFPDAEEMNVIVGGKNASADDAYLDLGFVGCLQWR
ncbi:MAG: hypothetical protein V1755_06440 [Chloroflexota bacterium]